MLPLKKTLVFQNSSEDAAYGTTTFDSGASFVKKIYTLVDEDGDECTMSFVLCNSKGDTIPHLGVDIGVSKFNSANDLVVSDIFPTLSSKAIKYIKAKTLNGGVLSDYIDIVYGK